jgi:two-component system, response regulator PdtaR
MTARFRVLIVDDNVFYAEALRALLERERHEVVGIEDRADGALALAARRRPDLALVDVNLRDGATGPELGRRLAEAGIGVVFVTGAPDLGPVREKRVGEVLRKPAGDARLLRAVAEAGRRLRREPS